MEAEMDLDISAMDFTQLDALRGRIEQRVTEMRETEAPALRERWAEEAAAIGMTMEEIVQAGKGRRGRGRGSRQGEGE
jgi:hypothetical protein